MTSRHDLFTNTSCYNTRVGIQIRSEGVGRLEVISTSSAAGEDFLEESIRLGLISVQIIDLVVIPSNLLSSCTTTCAKHIPDINSISRLQG